LVNPAEYRRARLLRGRTVLQSLRQASMIRLATDSNGKQVLAYDARALAAGQRISPGTRLYGSCASRHAEVCSPHACPGATARVDYRGRSDRRSSACALQPEERHRLQRIQTARIGPLPQRSSIADGQGRFLLAFPTLPAIGGNRQSMADMEGRLHLCPMREGSMSEPQSSR